MHGSDDHRIYRENVPVLSNNRIADGIYSLTLKTDSIAAAASPGQFVSLYSNDSGRLLPRPVSICSFSHNEGTLRLVFRIAGKGTEEFSRLKNGDSVDITGPLGNGFPVGRAEGRRVLVIGGGIGIPPMLQLAKTLDAAGKSVQITAVLGYRDEIFLEEEFPCARVISTENGRYGTKGTVLDAIRENSLQADVIYACGPAPMLRALKSYSAEKGTECWLSLEEKMACGIGACLSCVCRSVDTDEHSGVKNKRVCTEGPVFLSTDIDI